MRLNGYKRGHAKLKDDYSSYENSVETRNGKILKKMYRYHQVVDDYIYTLKKL